MARNCFVAINAFMQNEKEAIRKNPTAKLQELKELISKFQIDPKVVVAEDNQNVTSVPVQHSNGLPKDGTSTATFTMRQPGYTAVEDNEEDVEDGIVSEITLNTVDLQNCATVANDYISEVAITSRALPEDENGGAPSYAIQQGNVGTWSTPGESPSQENPESILNSLELLDLPEVEDYFSSIENIEDTNASTDLLQKLCSPANPSMDLLQKLCSPANTTSTDLLQKLCSPANTTSMDLLQKLCSPANTTSMDLLQKLCSPANASTDLLQKLCSPTDTNTDLIQKLCSPFTLNSSEPSTPCSNESQVSH